MFARLPLFEISGISTIGGTTSNISGVKLFSGTVGGRLVPRGETDILGTTISMIDPGSGV
tara:strand:+ start:435 stop:614 length:180 start_codon:yes stop_codon:yes gene_type:complete